ncbi:hypothetical protein P3T76_013222 [Phytophthora citrophthora]|uniref:Uncharacterized protein n=1 Tax=Phytophthora citrophthora TaxID=4793 RepID=A0AAD9G487_9STRA|nr:hypothetical protein P3T76_013222 [Phytophthora citrophthora]
MRWGSTGNNVGIGATLNGNASFYYYHEPVGPLGLSHGQPRGVQAKNPPDKRLGRSTVRSFNTLKKASAATVEANPEVEPGHSPLIVCAGRRFYGSDSAFSSEERGNNHTEDPGRPGSINSPPPNNQPEPFTVKSNSPLRQHTDEELEQIIRDLRNQVFQKNSTSNEISSETTQAQKHSRKHLKNPVEKMEAAKMPASASVGSTSHELLHRPLSSSQLNRFVAETTIQMVVPAVLTASPSTARIVGRTSSTPQVSSLDLSSLRRPRPHSSCVNPRSKSATSTRLRRQKKKVEQDDSSDCGEGYLYLVDESEGESEPHSLSPVGPWVVDSFTVETPRSPSASTCHSVSSFGSEDVDVGGACTTADLATMSPRSRLLYISACADDSETLRTQPHGSVLRRCGSALTSRALKTRNVKPKRCSSATTSTRVRSISASRFKTRRRKQNGSSTSSRSSASDTLATQR